MVASEWIADRDAWRERAWKAEEQAKRYGQVIVAFVRGLDIRVN